MEKTRLVIEITDELSWKVRAKASKQRQSIKDAVTDLLTDWVEE